MGKYWSSSYSPISRSFSACHVHLSAKAFHGRKYCWWYQRIIMEWLSTNRRHSCMFRHCWCFLWCKYHTCWGRKCNPPFHYSNCSWDLGRYALQYLIEISPLHILVLGQTVNICVMVLLLLGETGSRIGGAKFWDLLGSGRPFSWCKVRKWLSLKWFYLRVRRTSEGGSNEVSWSPTHTKGGDPTILVNHHWCG